MSVVGSEIGEFFCRILGVVEAKCVSRVETSGFNAVTPVSAVFSLLSESHHHVVHIIECIIPVDRVVERPVKTLAPFAVYSSVFLGGFRKICTHEITVPEILIAG